MKSQLIAIVAAVLVGCGESQVDNQSISIHMATYNGDIEAVKQHLAAGTDVNTKQKFGGITPLHDAGTKEMAELLIANGADVNAKDDLGRTPLDWATKDNLGFKTEIADLIRKHGGIHNNPITSQTTSRRTDSGVAPDVRPYLDPLSYAQRKKIFTDRLKGKEIFVEGVVTDISTDFSGKTFITLQVTQSHTFSIHPKYRTPLHLYRKGQIRAFVGTCAKLGRNYHTLENATRSEIRQTGKLWNRRPGLVPVLIIPLEDPR